MPPLLTVAIVLACIFVCAVLFAALVLSYKIKLTIEYKDALALYLHVPFGRIRLFPRKKKDKKAHGPHSMSKRRAKKIKEKLRERSRKKAQKSKEKQEKKQAETTEEKLTFDDVLNIISSAKDLLSTVLGKFFGHLKVKFARIHINVATGDAATTAIAYGAVCDALLHLFCILEPLDGFKLPKAKDVSVNADYLSDSSSVDIKISLYVRTGHLIHVALASGIKALLIFPRFKDKLIKKPEGQKNKAAKADHIKKGN